MQIISVDSSQREQKQHGISGFPVEINHDDLSHFKDLYIRCHWHEEFELSIVRQGRARYQLGSGACILSRDQGIFINGRVPHTVFPESQEPVLLTTLILHPSFLYGSPESRIATGLIWPLLHSRGLSFQLLDEENVKLLLEIDRLDGSRPFGYELKMKGLFCEAFFSMLASKKTELKTLAPYKECELERLGQLLSFLHAHYGEPLDLNRLSACISMTKGSCCRFFKKMTGQTLSQYLESYRISQSLSLLAEGTLSVTQIAAQVGFSNPGRFSAAFSRRMHCTPRQYGKNQTNLS